MNNWQKSETNGETINDFICLATRLKTLESIYI